MKPNFCPDRDNQLSENNPFTHLIGDLSRYQKPFHPIYVRIAEGENDEGEVKMTQEEALHHLIALGVVVRPRDFNHPKA